MEKGQISVQTENIFPIIKKFLYSDHEIFLRELISNAIDASTKLKLLHSKGEVKGELGELMVEIILDETEKTITIRDSGIGMTDEEVRKYLNQVAFSSAQEFLDRFKDESNIIGHFGLGFYSAFMVADKVEVCTLSYKEGSKAVKWICEGNPEYEIGDCDKKTRGTDVKLFIGEEGTEFLDKQRIQNLLDKYCKFLPVSIKFGTRTETTYEGEGDDKKEINTEVDNIVNNTSPLWKKQPSELSDEDYINFYNELYPYSAKPLFWIHLNIDYPFNLTGVLYFPKLNNQLELQRNKIQLYSNQVYVTDDVKEIVPEFLMLLHGIIDSPDIPLNVSRSYLQSDSNVRKITGYITKKVADKLNETIKNDRKSYEEKWSDIGLFVKYGSISDEKFYEKANNFILLKNTDNQYFTIDEYKEKIKANQTDKHNKLVCLYSNDAESQGALIASAKNKGYDVLVMEHPIDAHFMQHLEYKVGDIVFVRVDSDTVDNLVQKDEKIDSVLNEKEQEAIKSVFAKVITNEASTVNLKAMHPDDEPVVITRPEFMRRMKEMQMLQGMSMDFPDSYNVVINSNHPLIAQKLNTLSDDNAKSEFAKQLYSLALLKQNMLKGADLNDFVSQAMKWMAS
ncbi:MAG: molecular chaperone HtpG [Saprospiraceae bacterium]|nr:molecular chaperone HtpG [Saprospiraceae bacterium]